MFVRSLPRSRYGWTDVAARTSPTAARRRVSSLNRIIEHYIAQGDSREAATDLASNEHRWLREFAQKLEDHTHTAAALPQQSDEGVSRRVSKMVDELVLQNKPLAYILGTQPFHTLPCELLVRPPTLIPRTETEDWVARLDAALRADMGPNQLHLLDIGTGSGAIPLALAFGGEGRRLALAVDVAESSVLLARENTRRCGMQDRVRIVQADLFGDGFVDLVRDAAVEGKDGFDLVISNPPYVTRRAYLDLALSVKDWEDHGALVGTFGTKVDEAEDEGDDGLIYYRTIVRLLDQLLVSRKDRSTKCPVVVFEVGEGQARAVATMLEGEGFLTKIWKDQFEQDRVVLGYHQASAAIGLTDS